MQFIEPLRSAIFAQTNDGSIKTTKVEFHALLLLSKHY